MEKFSGERLAGSIKPDAESKEVIVGRERVALSDFAYVRPFEQTFWSRMDAGFDIGYTMTKANSVKQLTGATNVAYTAEMSLITLSVIFSSMSRRTPPGGGGGKLFPNIGISLAA